MESPAVRVLLVIVLVSVLIIRSSADDRSKSKDEDDLVNKQVHQMAWNQFKQKHKKSYSNNVEDGKRFAIWLKNKALIDSHIKSRNSSNSTSTYTLAENHLSDWTPEEYSRIRGFRSLSRSRSAVSRTFPVIPNIVVPPQYQPYTNTVPLDQLPASVNWTASGYVNPVEDQEDRFNFYFQKKGHPALKNPPQSRLVHNLLAELAYLKERGSCGDCWAFSAAGSMEGQYYNATKTSAILSEQNLLDCSSNSKYGNSGCNGGSMVGAFEYVIDNQGINAYITYPYTGQLSSTCGYNSAKNLGYITGYKSVKMYDEAALQQAVALIGPISVGINAHLPSFQIYNGGVYNPTDCNPDQLDHAVLAVGYGTTSDGLKYWLLKNSWGTDWGIQGYMMLARNASNVCGVATDASFPTNFVPSGIKIDNQGSAPGGASPQTTPAFTNTLLLLVVTFIYALLTSQI